MIDLTDIEQVKALQVNMRSSLDTPQGKEVMAFLEQICGWYDFKETDTNMVLIQNGKRQILATIKTLLRFPAEQIVAITEGE